MLGVGGGPMRVAGRVVAELGPGVQSGGGFLQCKLNSSARRSCGRVGVEVQPASVQQMQASLKKLLDVLGLPAGERRRLLHEGEPLASGLRDAQRQWPVVGAGPQPPVDLARDAGQPRQVRGDGAEVDGAESPLHLFTGCAGCRCHDPPAFSLVLGAATPPPGGHRGLRAGAAALANVVVLPRVLLLLQAISGGVTIQGQGGGGRGGGGCAGLGACSIGTLLAAVTAWGFASDDFCVVNKNIGLLLAPATSLGFAGVVISASLAGITASCWRPRQPWASRVVISASSAGAATSCGRR